MGNSDDQVADNRCPSCGEGFLSPRREKLDVIYAGLILNVDSHYCECPYCYEIVTTPSQQIINKRKAMEAHGRISSMNLWEQDDV